MGTKIVIGLTGGAVGFMLYALYHFIREGQRPQQKKTDVAFVIAQHRREHNMHSKAA